MKVVIFCGGMGVRMGEEAMRTPKPMIKIGARPILWHIMQYYASWGHTEFVLCLGHKGDVVKEYFLRYDAALSSDVRIERRGSQTSVEVLDHHFPDWHVTLVDTGVRTAVGERLKAVERYLGDDPVFLATYGDGLTDAPLDRMIEAHARLGRMVQFLSVPPTINLHAVEADDDGTVRSMVDMSRSSIRINAGFFVCRRELLDWVQPGDDLVEDTFARLIERADVGAYEYGGFFRPMDTMKDRQQLEDMLEAGAPPWLRAANGSVPAGGRGSSAGIARNGT